MAPATISETKVVPGSLLSQLSTLASPETFLWSRAIDAALGMSDLEASEIQARVERWTLDEVPLSGKLVAQILQWLYRDDRFCRDALAIRTRTVGPSSLHVPTLAVLNTSDEIAPLASVTPFLDAMPEGQAQAIAYAGEIGVSLQHLALLIGRQAQAQLWPRILDWLLAHRSVSPIPQS